MALVTSVTFYFWPILFFLTLFFTWSNLPVSRKIPCWKFSGIQCIVFLRKSGIGFYQLAWLFQVLELRKDFQKSVTPYVYPLNNRTTTLNENERSMSLCTVDNSIPVAIVGFFLFPKLFFILFFHFRKSFKNQKFIFRFMIC